MARRWRTDYNGQTKQEFQKNYTRVKDIVSKSAGDKEKEIKLARLQANKITDEHKALNRARAASELGYDNIFEVFFRRAYALEGVKLAKGQVQSEYRDYVLQKLLSE